MAKKKQAQKICTIAGKFVTEQQGEWDHQAWNELVAEVSETGADMGPVGQQRLGEICEAAKYFYFAEPEPEPRARKVAAKTAKVKARVTKKKS